MPKGCAFAYCSSSSHRLASADAKLNVTMAPTTAITVTMPRWIQTTSSGEKGSSVGPHDVLYARQYANPTTAPAVTNPKTKRKTRVTSIVRKTLLSSRCENQSQSV